MFKYKSFVLIYFLNNNMVSILEKIGIRQIKLGIIFIFMILIFVLLNNIFGFQENFVLEFDTNDYVLEYDGNVKGKQFNFKELETDKVIKTKELCIGETCVTPNDLMFLDKIPIVNVHFFSKTNWFQNLLYELLNNL